MRASLVWYEFGHWDGSTANNTRLGCHKWGYNKWGFQGCLASLRGNRPFLALFRPFSCCDVLGFAFAPICGTLAGEKAQAGCKHSVILVVRNVIYLFIYLFIYLYNVCVSVYAYIWLVRMLVSRLTTLTFSILLGFICDFV